MKNIAVLGSTGSIGTQTLDIIRANPDQFYAYLLVAGRNYQLLIEQALEFRPRFVVIGAEEYYADVCTALRGTQIEVLAGALAIEELMTEEAIDIVITAMVGFAGLRPTLVAIEAGKTIGLANKETLVVAGELIMASARKHQARIIPVDSEHSAIYQCLVGESEPIEHIILTASGGPFRGWTREQLRSVTPQQALKHPNWTMGAKVTIDSASLMNKGFEMIEARWLFDLTPDRIKVLVHPQSIIHSMVSFRDGSIKAQLGIPDMRLPISYALGLGHRVPNNYDRLDFTQYTFSFEEPDTDVFPNLNLAFEAIERGGNCPCVLNAANEIAVANFLKGDLSFLGMSQLLRGLLDSFPYEADLSLEQLEETDRAVREQASKLIRTIQ